MVTHLTHQVQVAVEQAQAVATQEQAKLLLAVVVMEQHLLYQAHQ
jgi:hypothetical protein